MLEAAADHIAVTMIREAFAHLPAERRAGALAMAKTEPMSRMLRAITVEAYSQGQEAGVRQGRLELEREMEDDWKPIAERARQSARAPSVEDRRRYQQEAVIQQIARQGGIEYRGGPVPQW